MIKKNQTYRYNIQSVVTNLANLSIFIMHQVYKICWSLWKETVKDKSYFFHSPGFFQLQISLRIVVRNFPSHVKFSSLPSSTFLFISHFKIPVYSSKFLKKNYMPLTKKIHSDLLQEIHISNVLVQNANILWNGLIF